MEKQAWKLGKDLGSGPQKKSKPFPTHTPVDWKLLLTFLILNDWETMSAITPKYQGEYIKSEAAKWAPIVKKSGATAEYLNY